MSETNRKLVHISGLLFVVLAQFSGKWIAAFYFMIIAATLLIYSEHIRREHIRFRGFLKRFEEKFRDAVLELERKDVPRPFVGAFWFFFGCGITFVIFPLNIASAACAMLAVGDGLATVVGMNLGRHKVVGKKSWEGSLVMFVFSLIAGMFFISPAVALAGTVAATIFELLPEAKFFHRHRKLGFVDDNWLVPLLAGAAMLAAYMFYAL
jgi:dolichol kinase